MNVNPAKTAEAIEMPFASTTRGPKITRVAYSGPLRANTALCSFNTSYTTQPSSSML